MDAAYISALAALLRRTGLRLGTNLGAVIAPNYARDYARGGGDYAEPQYGPPVLSCLIPV